jgi:hypothetical protein
MVSGELQEIPRHPVPQPEHRPPRRWDAKDLAFESSASDCRAPERDRRNQRRVIARGLAWAGSLAAVVWGIVAGWLPAGGITDGVGVSFVMIAMAFTFTVAVWFGHRRYR